MGSVNTLSNNPKFVAAFVSQSVSAQIDVFELLAPTGKCLLIHEFMLAADAAETDRFVYSFKRLASGYTSGSGGGTITPAQLISGYGTSGITNVEARNTTQASGTVELIDCRVASWPDGLLWAPPPNRLPLILPDEGFVVDIDAAPAGATDVSGHIIWEEVDSDYIGDALDD